MSEDLIDWLRRIIDEDAVDPDVHSTHCGRWFDSGGDCTCEWPARVLREVEAKRQLIDHYESDVAWSKDPACPEHERSAYWEHAGGMYDSIKYLATAYSDRPGFREEWRP